MWQAGLRRTSTSPPSWISKFLVYVLRLLLCISDEKRTSATTLGAGNQFFKYPGRREADLWSLDCKWLQRAKIVPWIFWHLNRFLFDLVFHPSKVFCVPLTRASLSSGTVASSTSFPHFFFMILIFHKKDKLLRKFYNPEYFDKIIFQTSKPNFKYHHG